MAVRQTERMFVCVVTDGFDSCAGWQKKKENDIQRYCAILKTPHTHQSPTDTENYQLGCRI